MTTIAPHEEPIHNRLEYFNELSCIMLQYMMVFFVSAGEISPEDQYSVGTVCMFLMTP